MTWRVYDLPGIITCCAFSIGSAALFWWMYPFGSGAATYSHAVAWMFLASGLFSPLVGITRDET